MSNESNAQLFHNKYVQTKSDTGSLTNAQQFHQAYTSYAAPQKINSWLKDSASIIDTINSQYHNTTDQKFYSLDDNTSKKVKDLIDNSQKMMDYLKYTSASNDDKKKYTDNITNIKNALAEIENGTYGTYTYNDKSYTYTQLQDLLKQAKATEDKNSNYLLPVHTLANEFGMNNSGLLKTPAIDQTKKTNYEKAKSEEKSISSLIQSIESNTISDKYTKMTPEQIQKEIDGVDKEISGLKSKPNISENSSYTYNVGYDPKKIAESRVRQSKINDLEKSKAELQQGLKISKTAKYESIANDPDFEKLARKGADIMNPVNQDKTSPVNYTKVNTVFDSELKSKTDYRMDLHEMTNDERNIYDALLARDGTEAADNYRSLIHDRIQQRDAEKSYQDLENTDPIVGTMGKLLYTSTAGTEKAINGLEQLFTSKVSSPSSLQYVNQDIINNAGAIGKVVYSAANGVGYMLPAVAISTLTEGAGAPTMAASAFGALTMSGSTYGNDYAAAVREGKPEDEAATYALMDSALQGSLYMLGGGINRLGGVASSAVNSKLSNMAVEKLGGVLKSVAAKQSVQKALDFGLRMNSQGTVATLQNILNPVLRNMAFHETNSPDFDIGRNFSAYATGFITSGILNAADYAAKAYRASHQPTDSQRSSPLYQQAEILADRQLKEKGIDGNWKSGYDGGNEGMKQDAYHVYLDMLNELKQAKDSGMTAREFATSRGVPSSLTDEEAAFLDKYKVKMSSEGKGEIFTQGSKIPKELLKIKPLNSPDVNRWLDNGGKIEIDDSGIWKYINSKGVSVIYKNGYPDFKESGYVKQEVDIGPFRKRSADFKLADQLAPIGPKSPLNTWHHNEDGITLQEVNRDIHRTFTHRGGISIVKRGGK